MRKLLICTVFLAIHIIARGQVTYDIRYWFDHDTTVYTVRTVEGRWTEAIDVSSLSDCLHTLHIQVIDEAGLCGVPETRFFMKPMLSAGQQEVKIHYWFDRDAASLTTVDYNGSMFDVDVNALTEGLHTLHVMAVNDRIGTIHTQYFMKTYRPCEYLGLRCYVDGTLHEEKRVDNANGLVNWPIDLCDYEQGLHHMQLLSMTPDGEVTSAHSTLFMRARTDEELASMRCYYVIDDSIVNVVGGSYVDNHYLFELDVTALAEGEHSIVCMLLDESGAVSELHTATFVKVSHNVGVDMLVNGKENEEIYDLSGRRLTTINKTGVYIVNGRKVLLKM